MTVLETIRKKAKTARWFGFFLIIAGILAIASPLVAGLSVALMVGVLLMVSGFAQLLLVFQSGSIGRGILMAILGLLSLAAGFYCVTQPVAALEALTLMLAAYFVAAGVIEIIAALGARPERGWGMLLSIGILSLLLGGMIWSQFPVAGAWAVGTLVGIRLLISGWTLVAIGGAIKNSVP